MVDAIKRVILKLFPELAKGLHLPMFAKVVAISDPPANYGLSDEFRPFYAVDVQALDAQGNIDKSLPVFTSVPLSLLTVGHELGFFAYPEPGALVVMSFAYGLQNKPFISQVLALSRSLPQFNQNEQIWSKNSASYQKVLQNGDWQRSTYGDIKDDSTGRRINAAENQENYNNTQVNVDVHASEFIGGIKLIEALGALKLLTGGSCNLSAANNLNITSGHNIQVNAGNDVKQVVSKNLIEQIGEIKSSIALAGQHIEGGTVWLGSSDTNVLALLGEVIQIIETLATNLAGHTHTSARAGVPTSPPIQAAQFSSAASSLGDKKNELSGITE